ncbi:MAG: L-aspartate oxidase [Thermoproteus sp. AZ2]|jgi:L-aspartate oxidase|uniref:L-aspartate oxidase n=1 Tax=Thermoproteus sp. AZ2 TaxID=1609232 RepID=A0ACC6UZM6_9CREN|nr:MAG: hypothetical protein TU35_05315 [Thermoproteus sp. AZ2]
MRAVVIGSGAAGLYAALSLRRLGFEVTIVTERRDGGSTPKAKGGVAAPIDDSDVEPHIADTLKAGDGLAEEGVVRAYIGLARAVLGDVVKLGFRPDRLVLEGGHSRARVLSAGGDATGSALWGALYKAANAAGVDVVESAAEGVLVEGNRAVGVELADGSAVKSDVVVAATGGYAGRYKYSSTDSSGDFLLSLFRAGALLRDLEFVQFHPTGTPEGELISEAVRGAGALLVNGDGERFMGRYDPRGELATRDVVARAVYLEIQRTGAVYLDVSAVDVERFTDLPRLVAKYGKAIPVTPVAHYAIGGAAVDAEGRSNIRGLFVLGEASNSGFHGANRLASNSLLECLVQGALAAKAARAYATSGAWEGPRCDVIEEYEGEVRSGRAKDALWEGVGVMRSEAGIAKALPELAEEDTLSYLIAKAAMWRRESRGAHYRVDAPWKDERYRVHLCFRYAGG